MHTPHVCYYLPMLLCADPEKDLQYLVITVQLIIETIHVLVGSSVVHLEQSGSA